MKSKEIGKVEAEILEKFERDVQWFISNYENFEAIYGEGTILAIKDRKIIAESKDYEELLKELKDKDENLSLILIESILPKNVAFIL